MSSPEPLSSNVRQLAAAPNFAVLSATSVDGRPSSYVMWIDHDERDLLINTTIGQPKTRHLTRGAPVSVLLLDPQSPYRYIELRGAISDQTDGPVAASHFAGLVHLYTGQELPDPPDNRRIYRITPSFSREHGFDPRRR